MNTDMQHVLQSYTDVFHTYALEKRLLCLLLLNNKKKLKTDKVYFKIMGHTVYTEHETKTFETHAQSCIVERLYFGLRILAEIYIICRPVTCVTSILAASRSSFGEEYASHEQGFYFFNIICNPAR